MVSFMCAIVAGYSIALHFILKKKKNILGSLDISEQIFKQSKRNLDLNSFFDVTEIKWTSITQK